MTPSFTMRKANECVSIVEIMEIMEIVEAETDEMTPDVIKQMLLLYSLIRLLTFHRTK